jgi:hypothetical protein
MSLQAVGASGAAALRPALHKAAVKGVNSVKRVTLESAEQSKRSLCLALLREVSSQAAGAKGQVAHYCIAGQLVVGS